MTELVMHSATARAVDRFVSHGFHAGLLIGPAGSGKATVVLHVGSRMLGLTPERLVNHAHFRLLQPVDGKAIPIESIRELQHFMTLKIPGATAGNVARIAVIEDAHLLTPEAQNALLKTLEEPPDHTALLLTATSPDALLPTIQSRVQTIKVIAPTVDDVKVYFARSYDATAIDKALLISGGLPGLTHAMLAGSEEHPLFQATQLARTLLQATAYERLAMVDGMSKQKQQCQDMLYILGQMSRMALMRAQGGNSKAVTRWHTIMQASYEASEQLRQNAQTKLVLTNLMLTV